MRWRCGSRPFLRLAQVVERRAGGYQPQLEAFDAVAFERVGLEMPQQRLVGEVVAEDPVFLGRDDEGLVAHRVEVFPPPFVDDHLGRIDRLEQFFQLRRRHFRHRELARRGVEKGKADPVFVGPIRPPVDGSEVLRPFRTQQLIVKRHTGRDHLDHVALDDLAGKFGIFELFADRHTHPGLDELREVIVEGVIGKAGQRHLGGGATRPLRQRDAEDLADGPGIVFEGLVEIAHAEEQDRVGMPRLDLVILPHERRLPFVFRFGVRHRNPSLRGVDRSQSI